MRSPRLVAVILVALGLGACADNEVIKVTSTSHEVAIRHMPDQRQKADQLAAATCADYDRRTRLRNRHDQHATMDQFGIYDCIPR